MTPDDDDYGLDDEPLPRHYEDEPPEPWGEPLGPEQPWDRRAADYAAADWAAWRTGGPA